MPGEGGEVELSVGEVGIGAQSTSAAERLRGSGARAEKSAPLSLVSVQPPALRSTARVLLPAGARALPSKQLALGP